jgi:putative flavoprotein involved in K+ transport
MGVTLLGHLRGADEKRAYFGADLADCVAFGDARYREICNLVRAHCDRTGIPHPDLPEPEPFQAQDPDSLDLDRVGSVIFTSGFRPDYASWVRIPGAFDEWGFPIHFDCQSAVAPGLFFVGVHFLRKRKSSIFLGVGEDAALVAGAITQVC